MVSLAATSIKRNEPMRRYLFVTFIVIILAMIVINANAATLRGNRESCTDVGYLVVAAGEARHAGVQWPQVQPRLAELVKTARKDKTSYMQTDEDAAFVVASIQSVWNGPLEPTFVWANKVYQSCMSRST